MRSKLKVDWMLCQIGVIGFGKKESTVEIDEENLNFFAEDLNLGY